MEITAIIVAVLSSGALFGFIQYMITRHDTRFDKLNDIEKALTEINQRMDAMEVQEAEREARQWRNTILKFADDCYRGREHSKEHFEDMLDMIANYNAFCENNPKFRNGKTTDASKRITDTYHTLLEEHRF